MIKLVLSQPLNAEALRAGGMDIPDELVLGPFERVFYEGGWFWGGEWHAMEQIAEVFEETMDDRMNVLGHPAAGHVFVPRTFYYNESDEPEYPGKGYARVTFEASS